MQEPGTDLQESHFCESLGEEGSGGGEKMKGGGTYIIWGFEE